MVALLAVLQSHIEQPGFVMPASDEDDLVFAKILDDAEDACAAIRDLLRANENAALVPIDAVISAGALSPFVAILKHIPCDAYEAIANDAAWCLTNIAGGTTVQARAVFDAQAVPVLIFVLETTDSLTVRDSAAWALANLAGDDDIELHTAASSPAALRAIARFAVAPDASAKCLATAAFAFWTILRIGPFPSATDVSDVVLPAVLHLLKSPNALARNDGTAFDVVPALERVAYGTRDDDGETVQVMAANAELVLALVWVLRDCRINNTANSSLKLLAKLAQGATSPAAFATSILTSNPDVFALLSKSPELGYMHRNGLERAKYGALLGATLALATPPPEPGKFYESALPDSAALTLLNHTHFSTTRVGQPVTADMDTFHSFLKWCWAVAARGSHRAFLAVARSRDVLSSLARYMANKTFVGADVGAGAGADALQVSEEGVRYAIDALDAIRVRIESDPLLTPRGTEVCLAMEAARMQGALSIVLMSGDSALSRFMAAPRNDPWREKATAFSDWMFRVPRALVSGGGNAPGRVLPADKGKPCSVSLLPDDALELVFDFVGAEAWIGPVCKAWREVARSRFVGASRSLVHVARGLALTLAADPAWEGALDQRAAFDVMWRWRSGLKGWPVRRRNEFADAHVRTDEEDDDEGGEEGEDEDESAAGLSAEQAWTRSRRCVFHPHLDVLASNVPILVQPSQLCAEGSVAAMVSDAHDLLRAMETLGKALPLTHTFATALCLFRPVDVEESSSSSVAAPLSPRMREPVDLVPFSAGDGEGEDDGEEEEDDDDERSVERNSPTQARDAVRRLRKAMRAITGSHAFLWPAHSTVCRDFALPDAAAGTATDEDTSLALAHILSVSQPSRVMEVTNHGRQGSVTFILARGRRGSFVGLVRVRR